MFHVIDRMLMLEQICKTKKNTEQRQISLHLKKSLLFAEYVGQNLKSPGETWNQFIKLHNINSAQVVCFHIIETKYSSKSIERTKTNY